MRWASRNAQLDIHSIAQNALSALQKKEGDPEKGLPMRRTPMFLQ
jgi:hypothetical protein